MLKHKNITRLADWTQCHVLEHSNFLLLIAFQKAWFIIGLCTAFFPLFISSVCGVAEGCTAQYEQVLTAVFFLLSNRKGMVPRTSQTGFCLNVLKSQAGQFIRYYLYLLKICAPLPSDRFRLAALLTCCVLASGRWQLCSEAAVTVIGLASLCCCASTDWHVVQVLCAVASSLLFDFGITEESVWHKYVLVNGIAQRSCKRHL